MMIWRLNFLQKKTMEWIDRNRKKRRLRSVLEFETSSEIFSDFSDLTDEVFLLFCLCLLNFKQLVDLLQYIFLIFGF